MSEIVTHEHIQDTWSIASVRDYLPEEYFNEATFHSLVLCSILVVLQVLDAVLTLSGVMTYGIEAEGNPLLFFFMQHVGAVPTIVIAKALAIGIIGVLFTLSVRVAWIPKALYGMIAIYICFAVIPWSYILLTY